MKHLTLVRHAKSSWRFPDLVDHDRPLNGRGERDAPEMGRRLAERNGTPDLVLSSPALRALTTAQVITDVIGYAAERIVVDVRIYEADVSGLLSVLTETDDEIGHMMVFGHNPAMTGMVNRLSSVWLDNLPTCGVAAFQFAMDSWGQLGDSAAVQVDIDYPKLGSKTEKPRGDGRT